MLSPRAPTTNGTRRRNGPRRSARFGYAMLGAICLATLAAITHGADPLQIVRVRIPSAKVASTFPQGSELRVLPEKEFEELVRKAESKAGSRSPERAPRLLRAKHSAVWVDGRLHGESELLVESPTRSAAMLDLAPWSPAVNAGGVDSTALRARNDGTIFLWVEPGNPRSYTVKWELQARPGADGRVFALCLPRLDSVSLDLDLPDSYLPEGPSGVRQGPMPGSKEGRSRWRFDGPGGLTDLRLRNRTSTGPDRSQSQVWVGGGTRVDVGEASASWRADWQVHFSGGGPRKLVVELDPGLEVLDVQGPALVAYQVEPSGSASRLAIRFGDDVKEQTTFTVRATTRVPDEGPWSVPAARPVDTAWTGGRTVVRVASSRVLEDCQDRAGFRISPQRDDLEGGVSTGLALVFASSAPRSVAELTFRRPEADASAEVRGQVSLSSDGTRLDAVATWRVDRGRMPDLTLDLPPAWTPERVQIVGIDEPTPWLTEPRIGGGTRVLVHFPPLIEAASSAKLSLVARGPDIARGGEFLLPHVLPVGVRISDEVWLARAGSDLSLRPSEADGLVWLAPEVAVFDPAALQSTLIAWRWIRTDGHARVEMARRARESRCTIDETISLGVDRFAITANATIDVGETPVRSLVVALSEPVAATPQWRLEDEESGPPLPAQRVPLDDLTKQPGLARGSAWKLTLAHPRRGRIQLIMKTEQSWQGAGQLPLVTMPDYANLHGTVRVLADRAVRTTAETSGLRVLSASTLSSPKNALRDAISTAAPGAPSLQPTRIAHAFGYGARLGRLKLSAESLRPAGAGSFISDGLLFTTLSTGGPVRHELVARIALQGDPAIEFALPANVILERASIDGRVIAPVRSNRGRLSVPLPAATPMRPTATLLLAYKQNLPAGRPASESGFEHPTFERPVLSWTWTCNAPGDEEVISNDIRLTATAQGAATSWLSSIGAPWIQLWSARRERSVARSNAEILRDLESRASRLGTGARSIQDLLVLWDGSPHSVLVDRDALDSAGIGARTILPPLPTKPAASGWLQEWARKAGLSIAVRRGYPVITTADALIGSEGPKEVAASNDELFRVAARDATATGSDQFDRFQAASQWIVADALGSRSTPSGGPAHRDAFGGGGRRFVSLDNTAITASVRTVDQHSRVYWAAAAAMAIVVAGIALRGVSASRKVLIASLVLVALAAASPWLDPRANSIITGFLAGACGVVTYWIGRALRPRGTRSPSPVASTLTGQPRRDSAVTVGVALIVVFAGVVTITERGQAQGQAQGERPILAVFPDEAAGGATNRAGTVILLLKDYERLHSLAQGLAKTTPPLISASSAEHIVALTGDAAREAHVESRLVLWVVGDGDANWSIPIAGARDLSASVDGSESVVHVDAGGQTATLFVNGPGRHEAIVRRTIPLDRGELVQSISIPVNAVPTARFQFRMSDLAAQYSVSNARGAVTALDNRIDGRLGPADRIELHRASAAANERRDAKGTAEGLILWDAEPSGDRLRARITYRNSPALTNLRLGLDPGLVVLSATVPGLVDTSWQGSKEHPEWVAQVDPAIPDGASIELILWRPAEAASAKGPGGQEESSRRLPRLEPLNVDSYSGTVAFRRPEGWSGRLRPVAGSDPVTDEAFAKLWGSLPDSSATLAGVIRFSVPPKVDVPTGPVAVRTSARPELDLEVQPGRLLVRARTALTDIQGRSRELVVSLPADFRLQRVDATGLTAWSRRSREQLRLRFDGTEAGPKQVQIDGWIPIATDPMALTPTMHNVPVPWLTPTNVEPEPGTVSISAQGGIAPQLLATGSKSGPVFVSSGTSPTLGRSVARTTYRVERPGEPLTLQWAGEPIRGKVTIRSLLAVHPDSAEWTATVELRATQGPIGAMVLKLPTAWAESARVVVRGGNQPVQSDVRGDETTWNIRFPAPEWGTQTLVIQSSRRLPSGKPLDFPDLVPLGRGTVETYLALVNASGVTLTSEGSSGLQAIDTARFPTEDFPARRGPLTEVFRVLKEGWRLRIRRGGADNSTSPARGTHVSLADVAVTTTLDGITKGEARYEVEPGHDAFLPVAMPPDTEVVGAVVDGVPTRPYEGVLGQILIPLSGTAASRVVLFWSSMAPSPHPKTARELRLPLLTQDNVPTLVTVRAPETLRIEAPSRLLLPVGRGVLELERAEWLGERIIESLSAIDRSSSIDQARLLASLVRFELFARTAERAINRTGSIGATDDPAALTLRLAAARQSVTDALQAAGLEEYLRSAEARTGTGALTTDPLESLAELPGSGSVARIPSLGRPFWFRTSASREEAALRLIARPAAQGRFWSDSRVWTSALSVLAVLLLLPLGLRLVSIPRAIATWTAAAATVLLAAVLAPASGALALLMLGVGKFSRS
jgi:hypothetical protein